MRVTVGLDICCNIFTNDFMDQADDAMPPIGHTESSRREECFCDWVRFFKAHHPRGSNLTICPRRNLTGSISRASLRFQPIVTFLNGCKSSATRNRLFACQGTNVQLSGTAVLSQTILAKLGCKFPNICSS